MSDHLPASPLPVDAVRRAPNSATYLYADGTSITLHGDRPYRNNNPGNLRYMGRSGPDRARADGALGVEQDGFAMFLSVSAGEAALRAAVAKALGVDASATLDVLGAEQRGLLAQTIMVQEGGASHGHEFRVPTVVQAKAR